VIKLTDSELVAVMTAARPIAPHRREAFLREIADELSRLTDPGPGDVGRAIRVAQRAHFDPPSLD
jgi:hypothetical protein